MRKNTIINLGHLLMLEYINTDSIVVDATLGNGHDSNYLAPKVKHVFGFDVLDQAIEKSKENNAEYNNITYINSGHENLSNYVDQKLDLVVYNLGYLPGFDKTYTTHFQTTLSSIKQALELLNPKKAIIISVYIGHENGKEEALELSKFIKDLDKYKFDVLEHKLVNKDNFPPYIIQIIKK